MGDSVEWNFFRRNVINCTIGANCTFYYQMGDSTLFCPVYSCVYWKHRKIMTTKNKSQVLTRNYGLLSFFIRKSRFFRLKTRFSQLPGLYVICDKRKKKELPTKSIWRMFELFRTRPKVLELKSVPCKCSALVGLWVYDCWCK